jgi:hypothetical protein
MIVSSFGRYLSQTAHDHEDASRAEVGRRPVMVVPWPGGGGREAGAPDIIEVITESEARHE